MTTFGDDLYCKRLYVDGKLIPGEGETQGLADVLTVSGDAGTLPIFNASKITTTAAQDSVQALDGDLNADQVDCNIMNAFSAVVTPECSATNVNATNLFGQLLTTQTNLPATAINCIDIVSSGTISYAAFNPPLSSVGTPSLAATMTVDNSVGLNPLDMNSQDIQNVNDIGVNGTVACETMDCRVGKVIAGAIVGGDSELQITNTDASTTAKINFTGVAGVAPDTTIEGDSTLNGGQPKLTKCSYLDLTDSTNSFPSVVAGDLAATLLLGNNAGSTGIDMNNQQLTNALSVGATAVQATQVSVTGALSASAATINGTATPNTGLLNMNASSGGTTKLDFTGVTDQAVDTEIEGDTTKIGGVLKRTKCTFLDLTDTTNLFTPSEQERYEWGGFWEDPRTTINNGPQYKLQVFMGSYEDNFPGWRYFRPMSDGEDQIITAGDIDKFAYIPYAADTNNPLLAFYVKTAPTTVAAHSSQIVQLSFPITRYGYGRIYLGLYYVPDATPWAAPVFIDQSYRLLTENIAQPGFADVRKGGHIMMEWIIKDVFPTDGTVWRVYPVVRTDDGEEYGALEIRIGDDPPFQSELTDPPYLPQNGQLFMYGRPWSQSFTEFSPQYGWPSEEPAGKK